MMMMGLPFVVFTLHHALYIISSASSWSQQGFIFIRTEKIVMSSSHRRANICLPNSLARRTTYNEARNCYRLQSLCRGCVWQHSPTRFFQRWLQRFELGRGVLIAPVRLLQRECYASHLQALFLHKLFDTALLASHIEAAFPADDLPDL